MEKLNTVVPPHDPAVAAALGAFRSASASSIPEGTDLVMVLRHTAASQPVELSDIGGENFRVDEHVVIAHDGGEIPVLLGVPTAISAPKAILYWIHGGGMVMGDHRADLEPIFRLAMENDAAVASVGYRVAPEHPGTGPVEDCYAGLLWVAEHAAEVGLGEGPLVVIGGSAGGGLAAGVTLMARDEGGPSIAGEMLFCPMLDDRDESPSTQQLEEHATWNRLINRVCWDALLGADRSGGSVSPYSAPARAENLRGLPPTFIDVGSTDLFRSEDVDYAQAIWLAGGVAELHVWPGGPHGYETLAPESGIAIGTIETRHRWLKRLLGEQAA